MSFIVKYTTDALGFIPYVMCPHFEDWPEFLENVKLQEYDAIGIAVSYDEENDRYYWCQIFGKYAEH